MTETEGSATKPGAPTTAHKIPQTCTEALWPGPPIEAIKLLADVQKRRDENQICEWTMGDAPGPVCEAVRGFLPRDAKNVRITVSWDGGPAEHTFSS